MKRWLWLKLFVLISCVIHAQSDALQTAWSAPPESAKPWTIWYWMHGAVTKEGITADLEAMAEVGLGGAYLMPIKAPLNPPHIANPVVQLSSQWWEMLRHSFAEAKRLGLRLGMHVSDGFALAGGPWITPELSMQKLVWTKTLVQGDRRFNDTLLQPETLEGFYKDVALYAYPTPSGSEVSTLNHPPIVTSSKGDSAVQYLAHPSSKKTVVCDEACWIQYAFSSPFTCRTIRIKSRNNYQATRLLVQASQDGINFSTIKRLQPPRHGWQDWDAPYTFSIPATTANFFRFVFEKEGTEPGAEDLDAAKWKPVLRLTGIELLGEAVIDNYEAKNGSVWRVAGEPSSNEVATEACIPASKLIRLTSSFKNGKLDWQVPPGNWTILRMGHTSTGHRNETAGGGKGLECDKFNAAAIRLQFDKWYGEVYKQVDADLVKAVMQFLHVDSWECGSQNWSSDFAAEFQRRRGYDLMPYLPVMAGVPVDSIESAEKILRDVRETIAELVNDKFYATLKAAAVEKSVELCAESVAPTMVSDGLLHYKTVDVPMGEFWLRSPTHDKPNDMLDAISGAHIYGKKIVQAEGFTQLRMAWDEHPGNIKTLLDRNYALGINRLVFHVFTHNPWLNRKPGMTLDAIGLYFQRDQTWWKAGAKAFVAYARRCQALLQLGKPVTDIAVYIGDEVPRRAVLPDRLVPILPGIFGEKKEAAEAKRLKNEGQPLRVLPAGVTHSANMADPEDWIDPLNGYAYDSYNKDALLRLTTVKDGKLQLSTGAEYKLLVLPGVHLLSPNNLLSNETIIMLRKLIKQGATVVMDVDEKVLDTICGSEGWYVGGRQEVIFGNGIILNGLYAKNSFAEYGFEKDFIATETNGRKADGIAWTHRRGEGFDIYFISNQKDSAQKIQLSLRATGKQVQIWNPVDGVVSTVSTFTSAAGRTQLSVQFDRNASLFVILQKKLTNKPPVLAAPKKVVQSLQQPWTVSFDTAAGGPSSPLQWKTLTDWSKVTDTAIRYYSGTATYRTSFNYKNYKANDDLWLNLGDVRNVAEVFVNGKSCGVVWTPPYRVNITNAVKSGENEVVISVTNTWANRLIGDSRLPADKRRTWTTYPLPMQGKPLFPAGLLGPVTMEK